MGLASCYKMTVLLYLGLFVSIIDEQNTLNNVFKVLFKILPLKCI